MIQMEILMVTIHLNMTITEIKQRKQVMMQTEA